MEPSQSLILEQLLVNDVRQWSVPLHLTSGRLSSQTQRNPIPNRPRYEELKMDRS